MSAPLFPLDANPLTLEDVVQLVALVGAIDGHPRKDVDVDVWALAAAGGRWTRAQVAAAAVTLTMSWTGFRIMPGHVTDQIAEDRNRIRRHWYCPDPPPALRDDPLAEVQWRRRAQRDYADRALLALAGNRPVEDVALLARPEPDPVSALPPAGQVRRMEAVTASLAERKAIGSGLRGPEKPLTARRWVGDPVERERAREELRARQPAEGVDPEAAEVVDAEAATA